MSLSPGTRIGSYEIIAAIGAGGMGEVYRARDSKLNRDVALKVLPASLSQDPDRLARFRREAQVLAALNHPNIAHIHGFEDSGDVHALVMELVDGETLAERIKAGPVAIADALPIAQQIALGMEAAHEQGIIHRDLKPANIKVREDGTVKILDFGLAKAAAGDDSGSHADAMNSPTLTARATQLGVILGTAAYMAPEQAKGRTVDRRADIWAFGVILYETITGKRGYEAEDISETLAAVLTREVDWTSLPSSTPARLKALVRDCLVRDPKQRLRDIGDARRELDKLIEGGPDALAPASAGTGAATAPPTPLWKRALPWAIAAFALVAAAVSMSGLIAGPEPPARIVTRADLTLGGFGALVAVSHDGTKVSYTTTGGTNGATQLSLRRTDQFQPTVIAGSDGAVAPVFSPDGQWIAYSLLTGNQIKKIPITGGTSIPVSDGSFLNGADWSDDGQIAFVAAKGLMEVSADGGTPRQITTVDEAKGELAHSRPQYLPGGRLLLFTVQMKDQNTGDQFAVLDRAAGTYTTVGRGGVNGRYARSGHLTYLRGNAVVAAPFDLDSLSVTGPEVPVIENVSTSGPDRTGDYAVSDNGLLVYFKSLAGGGGTTLAWLDGAGKTAPLAGEATRDWGTGRLSPNGQLLANGIDNANGGRDIWIYDVERGTQTKLSSKGSNDFPIWTSDSTRVYFGGDAGGEAGVYEVRADNSGPPTLVVKTESAPRMESVAPDDKSLIMSMAPTGGGRRLFKVDLTGSPGAAPQPFHEGLVSEFDADISPNGRFVAYSSAETGSAEVYVQAFSGTGAKVRISDDGGTRARWSRDGKTLYFWGGTPPTRLLAVGVPAGGSLAFGRPALVYDGLVGTTWDVTPTRDRFLIELTTSDGTNSTAIIATVTDWFEELRRRAAPKK